MTLQEHLRKIVRRLGKLFNNGGSAAQTPEELTPADAGRAVPDSRAPSFIDGSHTNAAGTREYKLYIPSAYQGQALPLVVMLHGCSQNPDDFAAGTQMNLVAEETPCLVVYPAQSAAANGARCWNWYSAIDQKRDHGEPSIIAGITRDIIAAYHADAHQVYVAGLSAGGAMAVIMGSTYPELYAAVGVHSGLPFAAARNLPSALAAMKIAYRPASVTSGQTGFPVIVFHGDKDKTVHPRNADHVIQQNTLHAASRDAAVQQGQVPDGHSYTRTVHFDGERQAIAEQWLIHGAGHAWSGGSDRGSYTDPQGPDATQEMMRFFTTRAHRPVRKRRRLFRGG
jgi:poly(hydroxyalkanoate) depolymerase family esterase